MFKKILFSCVAITLSVSSFAGVAMTSAATIVEGDLVKSATDSAVYLIQGSEKRVFPHANVYKSWGYPSDYSTVKTVGVDDLASYTDGTAVPFRDGSMFRGTATGLYGKDTTAVFYVSDGTLRDIKSAEIYQALFNDETWQYVTWVPDDLLSKFSYELGTQVDSSATYPNGAILQVGTTKYLVAEGKVREFSAGAYEANGYDKSAAVVAVYTVTSVAGYTAGAAVAAKESALVTPGEGAVVVTPSTGTGLTIALASDTPASTTVVEDAARVPFTTVNLTASSDGDISVQLRVQRTGLSQDVNIGTVVFIDAATNKQIGNSKTLSSSNHQAMSDKITVSAGTTKKVIISANMAADGAGQSGEVLGLDVVELITSATVNGTLPIAGNDMTMNTSLAIGTVTINRGNSDPNLASVATTKEIGTTNLELISAKIVINSTEAYDIEGIEFTNYNGTANDADLENLALYVDDEKVADGSIINGIVYFDLSASPVEIAKGKNKEFMLKGDIVDGSARTLDFDIYDQIDVIAKGQTYGYYRLPTYTIGGTTATAEPWFNANNTYLIGTGTITASASSAVPVQNVAEGGDTIALGSWALNAKGEPIAISKIRFDFDFTTSTAVAAYGSTTALTNVALYDENGTAVTSLTDMTLTTASGQPDGYISFTDTWTVPVGEHVYTIKGDLGVVCENGDTLSVGMNLSAAGYYTIKGETTNKATTPTPASNIAASLQTIKAGALAITTSTGVPASGTYLVVGSSNPTVLAKIIYDAGDSGENIKITKIRINDNPGLLAKAQYIDNVRLYVESTGAEIAPDSYPDFDETTAATDDYVEFNLTANPLIIPKGTSVSVLMKGVVNASEGAYTHSFASATSTSAVVARGVDTGESIVETFTTTAFGNALTVSTGGTMTISKNYSAPTGSLVAAGTAGFTVAIFDVETKYEDMTLDQITLEFTGDNASSSANDISTLYLYDGSGNLLASSAVSATSTTFRNLNVAVNKLTVPNGETKKLYVKVDLAQIGIAKPATSGYQIGYKLELATGFVAKGAISGAGTEAIGTGTDAPTGSTFVMTKAFPVITHTVLTTTEKTLAGTETNKTIYKFSVTADSSGGDVGLYKMMFKIATTTASATSFYLYDTTSGEASINASSGAVAIVASDSNYIVFFLDADSDQTDNDKEERVIASGATKTYEVRSNTTDDSSTGGDDDRIAVNMMFDYISSAISSGRFSLTAAEVEGTADKAHFIWSDRSASSHATSTSDWYNSYLVTGKATSTDTVLTD